MTVVCAAITPEGSVVVADSCSSFMDGQKAETPTPKAKGFSYYDGGSMDSNKSWLVVAGSGQARNVQQVLNGLQKHLNVECRDREEWLCSTVANAIIEILEPFGGMEDGEFKSPTNFMFVFPNEIWYMWNDLHVDKAGHHAAIGTGSDVVMGAIEGMMAVSGWGHAEQTIETAMDIACRRFTNCCRPFRIFRNDGSAVVDSWLDDETRVVHSYQTNGLPVEAGRFVIGTPNGSTD